MKPSGKGLLASFRFYATSRFLHCLAEAYCVAGIASGKTAKKKALFETARRKLRSKHGPVSEVDMQQAMVTDAQMQWLLAPFFTGRFL